MIRSRSAAYNRRRARRNAGEIRGSNASRVDKVRRIDDPQVRLDRVRWNQGTLPPRPKAPGEMPAPRDYSGSNTGYHPPKEPKTREKTVKIRVYGKGHLSSWKVHNR